VTRLVRALRGGSDASAAAAAACSALLPWASASAAAAADAPSLRLARPDCSHSSGAELAHRTFW